MNWICTKSKHGVDGGHTIIATVGIERGDRALVIHAAHAVDLDAAALVMTAAPELLNCCRMALKKMIDDGWNSQGPIIPMLIRAINHATKKENIQ
jgi:predicted kinase